METCLQIYCEEIQVNGTFTVRNKRVKEQEFREAPFLLLILVARMVMSWVLFLTNLLICVSLFLYLNGRATVALGAYGEDRLHPVGLIGSRFLSTHMRNWRWKVWGRWRRKTHKLVGECGKTHGWLPQIQWLKWSKGLFFLYKNTPELEIQGQLGKFCHLQGHDAHFHFLAIGKQDKITLKDVCIQVEHIAVSYNLICPEYSHMSITSFRRLCETHFCT